MKERNKSYINPKINNPLPAQKIVAHPYHHCIIGTWWFVNSRAGFCCSALHIHNLLGIIDVHTWHICLLSR